MSKIIIKNDSDLSYGWVMKYISRIIDEGEISKGTHGEQYCFLTTYGDPTRYAISCEKLKSGTQTFRVSNYGKKKDK